MNLPLELFLQGINQKKVYYFSSDKLNTSIPHYFICVLKNIDNTLFLVCCTSDKEGKRRKRIEKLGLYSTLVWIKPDDNNGLTKDTFVDCNSLFTYSREDFQTMYENEVLVYKGEITDAYYGQIINGLLDSPTISNAVKDMLRNDT